MKNNLDNLDKDSPFNEIQLDTGDKIYLITCSAILIGILFIATKKSSLF